MSQATNKTISFHLYPTGVKILGRTEFARRVESGQKAIDVNVDAMMTRNLETEALSNVITEKMAHMSPECFQMDTCFKVYLSDSGRHDEVNFLNELVAEHAPTFHSGRMAFIYEDSFQGLDCFVLDYQSKVA
jgi:hypothetical protein